MKFHEQIWDKHYTQGRNYYQLTAPEYELSPPLSGDVHCEVCIVGGGLSGLATAYFLLQHGINAVVIDRYYSGWGASGRNGGQLIPDFNSASILEFENLLGRDTVVDLWNMSLEGVNTIKDIIKTHNIECEYQPGVLYTTNNQKDADGLREHGDLTEEMVGYKAVYKDKAGLEQMLGTSEYDFGLFKPEAAHFHPLKYVYGLASYLKTQGVNFFDNTEATAIDRKSDAYVVTTESGRIRAKQVVLCGDSYLGRLVPKLRRKYVLIRNDMIGTVPLEPEKNVLPSNVAVCEFTFYLNFYRKSADGSLLFGGGGAGTPRILKPLNEQWVVNKIRNNMERIYPTLKGVETPYKWGGYIGITKNFMPNIGKLEDGLYYASGYSGHGLNTSHMAGKVLAEAVAGLNDSYKVFSRLTSISFPGLGYWDNHIVYMGALMRRMKKWPVWPRKSEKGVRNMPRTLLGILVGVMLSQPVWAQGGNIGPMDPNTRQNLRVLEQETRDLNKDGVVDQSEQAQDIMNAFKNADINGDGIISREERAAALNLYKESYGEAYGGFIDNQVVEREKRFVTIDKNRDGVISDAEYADYYGKRYKGMDRNGDGVVSPDEYRFETEKAILFEKRRSDEEENDD